MPQYVYNIDGQRHVFEGPDPQTTAQFAQRWASAHASAQAAAANDNRPQVGPRRSQFAVDLGARARQDVAGLTSAMDQVRAHPTSLLNGIRTLGAVTRYIPNALGLVPAAGVDQLTGPVVRGINSRFGTHFDPRYTTDQILNAAGLLSGAPEALGPETSLARAGETANVDPSLEGSGGSTARRVFPSATAQVGEHPQFVKLRGSTARRVFPSTAEAPREDPQFVKLKPNLSVAYTAPELHGHAIGQNSAGEAVVPLSDEFMHNHQQRMEALQDLPEEIQDKYHSAIADHIIDPILDDPDYHGHDAAAVQNILRELAAMAGEQRAPGGSSRLAGALDAAHEDFRVMVNQRQPEMAKELGLTTVQSPTPGAPSNAEPDANQTRPPSELVSFAQHVPPPDPYAGLDLNYYGKDIGSYLRQVGKDEKYGPDRVRLMMKAWKDIDETANDNAPLPNWAGMVKPQKPINYPLAEDFEPPKPLRDTMTEKEKQAWMWTAANDDTPQVPDPNLQSILNELWKPPPVELPPVEPPPSRGAPTDKLSLVPSTPQPSPANAFSHAFSDAFSGAVSDAPTSPQTLGLTTAPGALRQVNLFDFNALRPPRWLGPLMVGAANQGQAPPPQN